MTIHFPNDIKGSRPSGDYALFKLSRICLADRPSCQKSVVMPNCDDIEAVGAVDTFKKFSIFVNRAASKDPDLSHRNLAELGEKHTQTVKHGSTHAYSALGTLLVAMSGALAVPAAYRRDPEPLSKSPTETPKNSAVREISSSLMRQSNG
jgi:hypothetical protein